MARILVSILLGITFLVRASGVFAQTDAGTAEELLRSSGMWQQLSAVTPQIQAAIASGSAQAKVKPSPSEVERLSKLVDSAYAVERLRAAALATFTTEIRAEHVPVLRRWYSSRIGKAITGLEEAASTEQTDPQAVAREGTSLISKMPAGRRALLEEIVAVTRTAETMAQLTVDTALAAQKGLQSVTPDAPGLSFDELKSTLEAQRPQWQQTFYAMALASYAKAYTSLPTAALRQYVMFLKSSAGQHFMDVSARAFAAAMLAAATEYGRGLHGTRDKFNA